MSGGISVEDENEVVDRKHKERILQRREEVDEWELELYTQEVLGELSTAEANRLWGYRVRAYLKSVEPLLQHSDFEFAEKVYHQYPLGEIQVPPPPELQAAGQRRGRGRHDDGLELLDRETVEPSLWRVNGVRDVIEFKEAVGEWTVQVRDPDSPGRRRQITRRNTIPFPYTVLEDAVRLVDEWLQLAGAGVNIEAEAYRSEEPL